MARTLVLVRHAKAQARSAEIEDEKRELTDAGRRSCATAMSRVAFLVNDGVVAKTDTRMQVWSSPAVRALETATEFVSRADMPTGDIEVHPSLYADDPSEFLSEVASCEGTVVAFGHNPFLEEVTALLTGTDLHLGKAAAVAIELAQPEGSVGRTLPDDTSESASLGDLAPDGVGAPSVPNLDADAHTNPSLALKGTIAWFLQGPDQRRWATLGELEDALEAAGERIATNAAWLTDEPTEPEALHQYRVSLRVARSLASFVAPWRKQGPSSRLLRTLKELQGQTSHLRELDVLCDQLASEDASSSFSDAGSLLEACRGLRDEERERFNKYFARRGTQRDLEGTIRLLKNPAWRDAVEYAGVSADEVRGRFDELASSYAADLVSCDFTDYDATHSIRKRSKQQRYVARELSGLLGEGRTQAGLEAKEMQETLGELCDARVNLSIVRGIERDLAKSARKRSAEEEPALTLAIFEGARQALPTFAQVQERREGELVEKLTS